MRTLILTIALAVAAFPQQRERLKPAHEGWISLFNGSDLTGWVKVGGESWTVEDGTIHGLGLTKGYGYLKTAKDYKDFHLSLRFKCEGDGNSGVFYRTDFKPGTADVSKGYQFEIDRILNHHTGGIYTARRQWIVWPSPENELVIKQTEWNDYEMTVIGNHFISRLNGVVMVDFTDPYEEETDGCIALQLHAGGHGNMRFKDIYIIDLSQR